ncbi:Helix-turn-helix domain-containing protein [Verrucomicrobium sp. GAS474]|uniref:helix-turn-helix domain-containing protein n=1 Tax=Verrucomicrobium sp. GAS474 TaxID=1882831 RepID=UPI00087C9DBB|nr:AraC family transcriptional regulator [Verrucomicrobium sp. GAS474]SDU20164.1 Helix-turn-helix domain-containing protein [Verrucomicrobium sp. GAS474]
MKTSDPRPIQFDRLKLLGLSHYHQSPGVHPVPKMIPPGHELIELMTGGKGWVREGEEWREVVPGDLIWHKPGDDSIGRSEWENPYRCLAIALQSDRPEGLGIPRFSRWPEVEERNAFVSETVKAFYNPAFDRHLLLHYAVSRLLFSVYRFSRQQEQAKLPEPIREALKWIDRNYAEPCSVEALAKRVGWSAAHLHHAFRLHLGQSPHKALMARRIRAAQEQLASTRHPIKRVAVECGFADASALIHAFRGSQGMTPTAYRRQQIGPLSR